MDIREQVRKLVENKIEKIIIQDLKDKITDEKTSFDVEAYVDDLIDKYFKESEKGITKENSNTASYDLFYLESENSTDEKNGSHDSLELESNECQNFSAEEIIKYLKSDSKEVKKESLRALEASAEELINQSSWNKIKEVLQTILNNEESKEIQNLILKVFQRLLMQPKKPQIICKGFITITYILANQINFFNLKNSSEKTYDISKAKWYSEKKPSDINNLISTVHKDLKLLKEELLIKLMWLLIDCQQQIPAKWMRFNESRFREIIFSFIHLLSSTTTVEVAKLSGLEILSVLTPKANWCRYWCHTAIGRSLLCSALRKYKHFFVQIVEIILNYLKIKKDNRLPLITDGTNLNESASKNETNITDVLKPFKKNLNKTDREKTRPKIGPIDDRSSNIRSAPSELKENKLSQCVRQKPKNSNSEWVIANVPREIVNEAVFFHSVSFVSCLIQYRSGRALFPVQTATRKRLLSVQDLSILIIEYLENTENYKKNTEIKFTSTYQAKVAEILDILKKVKTQINSSRMSAERHNNFSYF